MDQARFVFVSISVIALLASDGAGQTAYPMLMSLKPVAVQVGKTAEVTVSRATPWPAPIRC